MYHSITFGNKNTWDDWKIVPAELPVVVPPTLKENYIDIPGADGSLDFTDVNTGHPVFNNRQGSFEFIVVEETEPWPVLYSEILNYLHGRKMQMVLEDDPNYYYEGRFVVEDWPPQENFPRVTIGYNVKPYKYSISETTKSISVSGNYTLNLGIIEMPIIPVFVVTSATNLSVSYKGTGYALTVGENIPLAVNDLGVINTLTFSGTGVLTVKYRLGKK